MGIKNIQEDLRPDASILHVVTDMDPTKGGVCQSIRTMIAGLAELGVKNELVSLDDADAAYIKADDFIIHARGEGKGPWRYNPAYLSWLSENISRFDVVIVHGLWLYHGYSARKALNLLKASPQNTAGKIPKLFIMPHGMLDPYFQQAGGRKLKAMRNWLYWKVLEAKIVNSADGVLFTCKQEQRLAKEPFKPYQPKKEIVVGLGVEEPPPYSTTMKEKFLEACSIPGNSPYLLFLSRIHEKKGLDLLIDGYKKIVETAAGMQGTAKESIPRLVIAGPGIESDFGQKIFASIKDSPELEQAVFFTGMLAGDAKWGAFYGCEAFVLPSHQENFGIAVVEAMACNKAVLISNQVNIWREIEDAKAGIVADDTADGTLSILNAWNGMTLAEKQAMGLQARDCFEKNFGTNRAAREIFTAFGS